LKNHFLNISIKKEETVMKTKSSFRIFWAISAVLIACTAKVQKPPVAPVKPVTDTFYGTKVTDDYRYMEDLKNPEVQSWIKAQADYAAAVLKSIPGRNRLFKRIRELDGGRPYRIFYIIREADGTMYYLKTLASENVGKLYTRRGTQGSEKLLVDPEKRNATPKEHHTLQFYNPSHDGRYVVYGLQKSGAEKTTLYVLDTTTGKDLPDSIDRIDPWYSDPKWLPDGKSFVYSRLQKTTPEMPPTEIWNNTCAYLHVLGESPDQDRLLLSYGQFPQVRIALTDFPSVWVMKGSPFCVAQIKHGDQSELSLYSAPVEALVRPGPPWVRICDVPDSVSDFSVMGDYVYLVTAKGAPRYKLVRTLLASPDFRRSQTVVPPGVSVVEYAAPAKDALYVGVSDAGYSRILRVDYTTLKSEALALPNRGSGYVISGSREIPGVLTTSMTWTSAGGIDEYDPVKKSFTDTHLRPAGKFDNIPGYESEEVMVKSHDGVSVPLSIVHKSGIAFDGSNPTLLEGYGSYGYSSPVYFSVTRLAWLERGGVFAVAHVRGGGEYGKQWHLAGQKLNKPNTWKDFIACAQYLIEKKYTSPQRLAGQGGSAGGILIGRAITERPDLFGAAVINVGDMDMIRAETTTNGVPNIPEFGSTKTEKGFRGLYEMSALHHVRDGARYPAVLLTHGINDPRVDPWNSAKMTARLQAASASGKPVLFRVDYESGHGIGSTKTQNQQELADEMAFLFRQLGARGGGNQ
jgi:prolyl oligopeptidase